MVAQGAPGGRRHLLLVDSDQGAVQDIVEVLQDQGFDVDTAGDGQAAIAAIRHVAPDLVVLDVGIPGASGFEVLAWIKDNYDVPVILVAEHAEEVDRVLGLELGADDYLTKPVPRRELAARARAILRRLSSTRPPSQLRFGELLIDPRSRKVAIGDRAVDLRPREFDLLLFLASSPGQAFTRGQILEHVWQSSSSWQDPDTVTEHVRRVRRKLEPDPGNPTWIITVRGVGYRFEP